MVIELGLVLGKAIGIDIEIKLRFHRLRADIRSINGAGSDVCVLLVMVPLPFFVVFVLFLFPLDMLFMAVQV